MKPDAKGWYWWEKARIRVARAAWVVYGWYWDVTSLVPARWRPWAHESRVYLWVCAKAYLYDDLKRDDLPENERAGGIWA